MLRIEKDALKKKNYDDYLHVWEGKCRQSVEGAVYAEELRQARLETYGCHVGPSIYMSYLSNLATSRKLRKLPLITL